MQWWKSVIMLISVSIATIGMSAQAETFVATRFKTISLSFSGCIIEAKNVLKTARFEENLNNSPSPLEDGSGAVWGGKGEYKAVIKCLPEHSLVFFVVAGPKLAVVNKNADNLINSFTGDDVDEN
ncbi:MAG: hypothetical protein BWK79_11800 [Beggiatoa sp. IS2]|nr:MAG: hypothetical protein BWK79_11800 [Beggiatoa sp. IS2]